MNLEILRTLNEVIARTHTDSTVIIEISTDLNYFQVS